MRKPDSWKVKLLLAITLMLGLSNCAISAGLKQKPLALPPGPAGPERRPVYEHAGWLIARASLHNHTIYSDGCRTPEDLLEMARRQGMAILAYTDHREGKLCAGQRGLLCAKVNGVESVGYQAYYEHLRNIQAQAEAQGILVLKGAEVIPYFYNYGKFPALVVDGLQAHFVVYGIEDPQVFEQMPARRNIPLKPEPIPDETPWAQWVDYMAAQGGIVSVAHLEEGGDQWYGPAHGACPAMPENLHRLKGLTDFAVLAYAWHEATGGPGGLWDTVLVEYLLGMRDRPIWALADADYHCDAGLAIANTLFYLREFNEPEIYQAMREGRMVAFQGDAFQDSFVAEWWINDSAVPPAEPMMLGREVKLSGAPVLRFALDHPVAGCRVRLIRNGNVIAETEGTELTFRDEELGAKQEPAVYRIEVVGPRAERGDYEGPTMPASELFVNPIFVRFVR